MELRILADAATLTLQFIRCGAETARAASGTRADRRAEGDPVPMDSTGKRSGTVTITVQTGAWPSGFYAAG